MSSLPALVSLILVCLTPLITQLTAEDDVDNLVCLTPLITQLTAEDDVDKISAYEALKEYGFPAGLLPQGATGYELDPISGKFSAYLSSSSCSFSIAGYQLKYKHTITGVISKGKLTNLKGVSVKILFIWINIIEVINTDGELEFSVGIASADFPIDNFDESPQCGCGFDCGNDNEKKDYKEVRSKGFNTFVSSS